VNNQVSAIMNILQMSTICYTIEGYVA